MNYFSRLGGVGMLMLPVAALCQINSGPLLKQACETSAGNVVQIAQSTKIEFGPDQAVNSACTIQLANGVSFEVKQVNMSFAGPLAISAVYQNTVVFEEAVWSARSIDVAAVHYGQIIAKKSGFKATAGDILLSMSHYGKFELIGPAAGSTSVLDASGAVTVSTGINGSAVMEKANIRSGAGVLVRASSTTPLKVTESDMSATLGSVAVSASTSLEVSGGAFTAANGVSLGGGASAMLKVKDVVVSGGTGSASIGVGASGKVELNQSTLSSASTVTVGSGGGGQTLVDNVQLDGAAGVLVQSGAGTIAATLVKNSRGTSAGSVIIRAGGGALCTAESNVFTAPIVQACGTNF